MPEPKRPVSYDVDEDRIAILTLDDPDHSVNMMHTAFTESLTAVTERLRNEIESVRGVIVVSAKPTFFAGGDLTRMMDARPEDFDRFYQEVESIKAALRMLESIGKPVVAALNGSALGGGLELALATHFRIAVAGSRSEFGLPEVGLGLLPGCGGIVRTVRKLGVRTALGKVALTGTRHSPESAFALGLIDQLVASPADLMTAAKAWIDAHEDDRLAVTAPWDRDGFVIPGEPWSDAERDLLLASLPGAVRTQLTTVDVHAPRKILEAAVSGVDVDFDEASRIESRAFATLVTGQQFKNTAQAAFFDIGAIRRGASRPAGVAERTFAKLAVIGAGMMGSAISYVSADAGLQVALKDTDIEAARRGKSFSQSRLAQLIERGSLTQQQADAALDRILPTDNYDDLVDADIVIEAVFESVSVKHAVFGEFEPLVRSDALLASNTSTLPISELADGVTRSEDFIGIHFFSPVEKMQLVEIIVGERTSDATIAGALDYVKKIRKVPIVVNDCRGFFTSRVIRMFLNEGIAMMTEGVAPALIEQAAVRIGFPVGPLQLSDELKLDLSQKIAREHREAVTLAGGTYVEHPAEAVIDTMIELGRLGRSTGAAFFDYDGPGGRRIGFWPGLAERYPASSTQPPVEDIEDRLLFIMSLESVRCIEENVLRTVADANIGSIYGIGFPAHQGGTIQFINGHPGRDGEIGVRAFTRRADELADRYGDRFVVPELLRVSAENDSPITDPLSASAR